jgi:flagellar basal body-associated protein FliL
LVIAVSVGTAQAKEKENQTENTGPSFVEVPWLTAPVLHKGVVRSYVIFEVKLQVASEGDAEDIRVQMPRLRDAFLRALNKYSIVRNDGSGALDFEQISVRLRNSANKILGEDKVDQVLIVKAVRGAA